SPARSMVPATFSPVVRLSVSVTGTATTAPGASSSAASVRSMIAAVTNGRAASWTRTCRGRCSTRLSRPLRTDSWRLAPPNKRGRTKFKSGVGGLVGGWSLGIDAPPDPADAGMPGEARHGMAEHRLSRQFEILLGNIAAEARAGSGGDDDGDTIRHGRIAVVA